MLQGRTRIRVAGGTVPVEELCIGQPVLVLSPDGRLVPKAIVWIGHRSVDCRHHPSPHLVWPVRIRAGTFGGEVPCRDLFLSPDHAVFVDGALIPVKHLINDGSIEQIPMDKVTYFHIELQEHSVLLAEDLPTESYLETGDRSKFPMGQSSRRCSLISPPACGKQPDARRWSSQAQHSMRYVGASMAPNELTCGHHNNSGANRRGQRRYAINRRSGDFVANRTEQFSARSIPSYQSHAAAREASQLESDKSAQVRDCRRGEFGHVRGDAVCIVTGRAG